MLHNIKRYIVLEPIRNFKLWINPTEQYGLDIFMSIVNHITFISWAPTCSIYATKMYLLYYDHEYERILASEKWTIFIDPNMTKNNWFFINKNKYGNAVWIIKYLIIPSVILFAILRVSLSQTGVAYQEKFNFLYLLLLVWSIPHVIVGVWCWRKYPKFHDTFGIKKELIYFVLFALVLVFSVMISGALVSFVNGDLDMLMGIFISLCADVNAWILVIYPQKANQIKHTTSNNQNDIGQNNESKNVEWREIIATMDGYEQFAAFLQKEFSTENILFVTEYVQLKHELIKVEKYKNMIEDELKLDYDLSLPSDIPQSIISKEFRNAINKCEPETSNGHTNTSTDVVVLNGLYGMYKKYIDSSTATMGVNISSYTRNNLTALFKNNSNKEFEINKIFCGMETAVQEISYLMKDSTARFRMQSIFTEIIQLSSHSS